MQRSVIQPVNKNPEYRISIDNFVFNRFLLLCDLYLKGMKIQGLKQ